MPPHVFAVSPRDLRYGCFVKDGERFELGELYAVELPAESFGHGPLGGPSRDAADFQQRVAALVERISVPVDEASLVVPDAWVRMTFVEAEELPRKSAQREEVLRWKLRRLVPYRVDELRLRGVPVTPLPGREEPLRILLGFGIEALLAQLEQAFAAAGVQLGQISNDSLALLAAVEPLVSGVELAAVALVHEEGYSLVFVRRGEPVIHRYKPLHLAAADQALATLVPRDLRLTRTFLEEHLPESSLELCLVAVPEAVEERWSAWIEEGLGRLPVILRREHLPVLGEPPTGSWAALATMVGAVCREVV